MGALVWWLWTNKPEQQADPDGYAKSVAALTSTSLNWLWFSVEMLMCAVLDGRIVFQTMGLTMSLILMTCALSLWSIWRPVPRG